LSQECLYKLIVPLSRLPWAAHRRNVVRMSRGRSIPWRAVAGILAGLALTLPVARGLARPPGMEDATLGDPLARLQAQHVLVQLALREAGVVAGVDPLVLTPAEVNAFLAQLQIAHLPVRPLRVRLDRGSVQIGGPTPLGRLLERRGMPGVASALPGPARDYPVWLTLRARVVVRPGQGELLPDGARVGRQAVPVSWLWSLLGSRPGALTWSMPRVVERVEVTPEALVIHTRVRAGSGRRTS
jgi:hypothetical protein